MHFSSHENGRTKIDVVSIQIYDENDIASSSSSPPSSMLLFEFRRRALFDGTNAAEHLQSIWLIQYYVNGGNEILTFNIDDFAVATHSDVICNFRTFDYMVNCGDDFLLHLFSQRD